MPGDKIDMLRDRIRGRAAEEEVPEKTAAQLADEHWGYVKELLELHDASQVRTVGWHYRTAFIHGYKHGQEAVDG